MRRCGNATRRMQRAFDALRELHDQVWPLADVRCRRRWTAEEYDRYLSLLGAERRAVRPYLAARRSFDSRRRHSMRSDESTEV